MTAISHATQILDPDEAGRIMAMDTKTLRDELERAVTNLVGGITRLLVIYRELQSRGEDLSNMKGGLLTYLPLMLGGAVRPALVAKFIGRPAALRVLAALPPDVQDRIAAGEPVSVAVPNGDGFAERMLPIHALGTKQIRQVVGERSIRSMAEQIGLLGGQAKPKAVRSPKHGKLRANPAAGLVMLGRRPLKPADLLAALADLRSQHSPDLGDDAKTVPVKLTPDEHKRLASHALAGDTTMQAVLRNALRTLGII